MPYIIALLCAGACILNGFLGTWATEYSIAKQCNEQGYFQVDKELYQCKPIAVIINNHKFEVSNGTVQP